MPVPVLAWTAVLVFLARILHLRLAIAAPGVTVTVPVPQAALVAIGLTSVVLLALAGRAILRPAMARSTS